MIQKYRKIAIVYGGSGNSCAKEINDVIEKRHKEELLPIQPQMLQKNILDSQSIMNYVLGMLKEAAVCVIILTFDDAEGTRVRQNVLIETGAAWALRGKENCIFLSNQEILPDDFPSNIKTDINVNPYKSNQISEKANQVCDEIVDKLNIFSSKGILTDGAYYFDGRILDDIPETILEKKADIQLHEVLQEWEKNLRSFDYLPERVMYLLERIPFLPIFNTDDFLNRFLDAAIELMKPSQQEQRLNQEQVYRQDLKEISGFMEQIIDYTQTKLEPDVIECLKNPAENLHQAKNVLKHFERIDKKLQRFMEQAESSDREYNWLIRIVAYDYLALTQMKIYEINRSIEASLEKEAILDKVIDNFEKAADIGEQNDLASNHIWLGFLKYNLARAYRHKYELTGNQEWIDKFDEALAEAIDYRRGWYKRNVYKGVFATAMSYEYFLAAELDYSLRNDIVEYTNDSPEENLRNVEILRDELNQYCKETELGKLYDVRDRIDALSIRIRKEHGI